MAATLRADRPDITRLAVAAIVNAANESLLGAFVRGDDRMREIVYACFSAAVLAAYRRELWAPR